VIVPTAAEDLCLRADTAAIVLGAGQGLRFGGTVRKQYVRLRGKPVLWWSLSAFNACPSIGTLILVAPKEDLPRLRKQAALWRFPKLTAIVAGGKERSDSVKEGLKAIPSSYAWVAVHDGVRPLITSTQIDAVLSAARKHQAAIAATPSRDTIKIADDGSFVRSSPDRRTVWQAQTPQIFSRSLLEHAHRLKGTVTDDAQLVERAGVKVKLVDTSAENIKVTHPMDLKMAEIILKGRS
jgi:2-C-methyl-D-erythritol 4-phosphate cytidylyltransferase